MKLEEITVRIRRFEEVAIETDNPNIHNTCQNILSVLQLMHDRWFNDWYDEESDFKACYSNTVEEMVELANEGKVIPIPDKQPFIFR